MKPLVTTVEEVLRKAILAEDQSRSFYLRLAERASSREVLKKLMEIADRQVAHRVHLEKKYRRDTGEEPPPPDLPRVELPAEFANLDMAKALKIVRDRERDAESEFRFNAERVPGTELGALFWELADFKWKHKNEIQNEMNLVGDPEGFLTDL
jgi:rubrerythrin